ncbi:MAG TPA: ABC transporter permease [Chloroflexia bacterium]|nr:ABC transporter permease [Chloroflexia bacterium]
MRVLSRIGWRDITSRSTFLFSLFLLAVAVVVNVILQPNMLEPGTLNSNMRVFLPLILVAVGQAVVILSGGIDVSAGAIVSIVNTFLATQIGVQGDTGTALLMIMLAPLVGMAAGAVNGFFVAILRLQPIITTYATSFLFAGLALFILPRPGGGVPISFQTFYRDTRPLELPLAFYVIGLILLAWFGVRRTRYGRYLYAVGGKAEAAYETGVPVNLVQFSAYVISGLMAALGGIALTLFTGSGSADSGAALTLASITAVVIGGTALSGGTGGIGGAIIGAIILGIIPNIISFANIDVWWQTFFDALIIVVALALPGIIALARRRRT